MLSFWAFPQGQRVMCMHSNTYYYKSQIHTTVVERTTMSRLGAVSHSLGANQGTAKVSHLGSDRPIVEQRWGQVWLIVRFHLIIIQLLKV